MVKASSPRVGGYSLGFFPALVKSTTMQPSGPSKPTASVGDGPAWISRQPNRHLLLISCMALPRGMIETHDVGGWLLVSLKTVCHHIRMRGMIAGAGEWSTTHNMSERGVAALWGGIRVQRLSFFFAACPSTVPVGVRIQANDVRSCG
jgi:hypothetical protein